MHRRVSAIVVAGAVAALGLSAAFAKSARAGDEDAAREARDDLSRRVALEKIPGDWRLGPLFWDPEAKRTIAEARLVFPADPSDALAVAPYLACDRVELDVRRRPHVVRHADPAKLGAAAARTSEARVALEIARARLKTLPRYRFWKSKGWKYETVLRASGTSWVVSFDTPGVTDQLVGIEIDVKARTILKIVMGDA